MIDKVNMNGHKRISLAWSFFKKLNQKHARCNYCDGIYTYDTTSSHLLKHVKKKHSDAYLQVKQEQEQEPKEWISPIPPIDETSTSSCPAVNVPFQTDESQNVESGADEEKSSDIWSLFTRADDMLAECNLCQIKLPYDDSIADLIAHKVRKHSEVFFNPQKEPSTNGLCDKPVEEKVFLTQHSCKYSEPNDNPAEEASTPKVNMKLKKSRAWQYFILIDKTYSRCKFCGAFISHLSISNLMRHVVRKHPLQLLARACKEKEKIVLPNHDNEEVEDDDSAMESQNPSISDGEEDSEGEICEEVHASRRNASSANETSELRRSKRMKTDHPPQEEESATNEEAEDGSANEDLPSPGGQNAVSEENTASVNRVRSSPSKRRSQTMGSCSSVWANYIKLQNGCFQCKMCGNTMAKSSSISNLWRHMRRVHSPTKQKKSAFGKARSSGPIIHILNAEGRSTSDHPDPSDERLAEKQSLKCWRGSGRAPRKAGKSPSATRRLCERLVLAVEESNRLLRSLQSAVERQGGALQRLAACLEGMKRERDEDP